MPLTEAEQNHLNKLFNNVGFEDEKGEETTLNEVESPTGTIDTLIEETTSPPDDLDTDILDLLDDTDEQTSEPQKDSMDEAKSVLDDEEEYGFLDEPGKKKSHKSNRSSDQEKDDAPPIESHIMPKSISFNLQSPVDSFNETLERIGELDQDTNKEETSYLDDQESKSSRLMSRVKQQKEQDDTPVESHTLPGQLTFNVKLAQDQFNLLLKEIGEETSKQKTGSDSFLDEQESKSSRLMSRVKQQKEENDTPVESHTLPSKLSFNTRLEAQLVKDLLKALGEHKG